MGAAEAGHGHGPGHTTILVNGREKKVEGSVVTFTQVVGLSGLQGGENILFTVTFTHAPPPKTDGTLLEGQSTDVKNGTRFNVTTTLRS